MVKKPRIGNNTKQHQRNTGQTTLFKQLGVEFKKKSGKEEIGTCPFCDGDKFYVNRETGQWDCKHCGKNGNQVQFVRYIHTEALKDTKDTDYRNLKVLRGGEIDIRSFKAFGLAYYQEVDAWLVPFKNVQGKVTSLQLYRNKKLINLAGFNTSMFGLDKLESGKEITFLCEGPWDAIALYYALGDNRNRYNVLAQPGSGFKPEWCKCLSTDYALKVRALFDNDDAGRGHADTLRKRLEESEVSCDAYVLRWPPNTPDKYDINDFVNDNGKTGIVSFTKEHSRPLKEKRWVEFSIGSEIESATTQWLDRFLRIELGKVTDFSGNHGTGKSTFLKYLAACITSGQVPGWPLSLRRPPAKVAYFCGEDSEGEVRNCVEFEGGNLSNLLVYDMAEKGFMDIPAYLHALIDQCREENIKLIVIDPLNNFIQHINGGDAAARKIANKLVMLAKQANIAIVFARNWGRDTDPTKAGSQKALGHVTFSAIARCVLNTKEITPDLFCIEYEKTTNSKRTGDVLTYRIKGESEKISGREHVKGMDWVGWMPKREMIQIQNDYKKKMEELAAKKAPPKTPSKNPLRTSARM